MLCVSLFEVLLSLLPLKLQVCECVRVVCICARTLAVPARETNSRLYAASTPTQVWLLLPLLLPPMDTLLAVSDLLNVSV